MIYRIVLFGSHYQRSRLCHFCWPSVRGPEQDIPYYFYNLFWHGNNGLVFYYHNGFCFVKTSMKPIFLLWRILFRLYREENGSLLHQYNGLGLCYNDKTVGHLRAKRMTKIMCNIFILEICSGVFILSFYIFSCVHNNWRIMCVSFSLSRRNILWLHNGSFEHGSLVFSWHCFQREEGRLWFQSRSSDW